MVVGWCDGVADAPAVVLSPRSAERSADLAARFDTVRVAADNQAVVDEADVVVVCLLPGNAAEVLAGLRFRPDQAVVSAVAGVDVARLREVVAPASEVARSIPLPAVATRESVTPVHPARPGGRGAVRAARRQHGRRRRAGVRGDRGRVGDGGGVLRLPRRDRRLARRPGHPRGRTPGATSRRRSPRSPASSARRTRTSPRSPTRTRRRAGSTSSSPATSARPGCTTRCGRARRGARPDTAGDCPELKHVLVSGA